MNINKLGESVFSASAKKDLCSSSAEIQKRLATALKPLEEKTAEVASNPKFAKLLEGTSKKITTPKNLNLEYFTSNIKKLAK